MSFVSLCHHLVSTIATTMAPKQKIKFVEVEAADWVHVPPKGTTLQQVGLWLYDHKERTVLGRNMSRWVIVFVFYTCFYGALALMTALCMIAFDNTIDGNRPTYILEQSSIGGVPAITHVPRGRVGTNSSLRGIPALLEPYENETWFQQARGCKPQDNYGYPDNPCFYIKVNKLFGWRARPFDVLPEEADEDLRNYVSQQPEGQRRQLWFNCWLDPRGALGGLERGTPVITWPWGRGIPESAFPYTMQPGYLSALVAVQVSRASRDGGYFLRCRVWAENIPFDPSLVRGSGFVRVHCQM